MRPKTHNVWLEDLILNIISKPEVCTFTIIRKSLDKTISSQRISAVLRKLKKQGIILQNDNKEYDLINDTIDINEMTSLVISSSKQYIEKWIDAEFETKLILATQQCVKHEFKKEILPLLLDRIDSKINKIHSLKIIDVLIESLEKLKEDFQ